MGDQKMNEWQGEVFICTTQDDDGADERRLVVIDSHNNMFQLEPHDFAGEATKEEREKLESIGVFNLY